MKPIPGFPGYMATAGGEIFSLHRDRCLKPCNDRGYLSVVLRKEKKSFTKSVHRLVASAFIGVFEDLEVGHLNEDKADNRPGNLIYRRRGHKRPRQLKPIQLQYNGIGMWFPSQVACTKFTGLTRQHVSQLFTGRKKSLFGYTLDEV